jgi:ribonuclease J
MKVGLMQESREIRELPELLPGTCRIIPLGGLGEIGKNMLALECGQQTLIIDAGMCFPSEDQPGIDFIVPDVTYLKDKVARIVGIVLTHGHEDHVGALPYILRQLPVPIYGTRMTLGLVRNKLEEHGLLETTDLHEVKAGDTVKLGVFEITFIPVAHSIVDAVGLAIRTSAGTIVHTGDFKLDPTPVDGKITDLGRFAEFGRQGVDLLLADSTNAERDGYTLSEREVGLAFDEIVRDAPRRVVIACFSSNIHRFQQVINTAVRYKRKIGVLGMSMVKNMRTAQELGYLLIPESLWLKWNDLINLPPEKSIVLTTGSQGEPRSALARTAVGENQELKLEADDTVIISARTIPGNERRIGNMINHFFRMGCKVHYERVSEIHVSGHAAREELKVMHNIVQPKNFIPIHGESRHLYHHADLARELGMPGERIMLAENGDCIELSAKGLKRAGKVPWGSVLVDGKGVGDVGHVVLRDRQHLAQDGMLIVVMGLNRQTGELISGPDLTPRGIADEPETSRLMEGARYALQEALSKVSIAGISEASVLQDITRSSMKKYFKREIMRFPMIIPVIVEV